MLLHGEYFSGMNTEGSVADRLKLARKAREYTQGELAGLISCSRNTLSAAENGKSVLSARLLHAVSEKLWISENGDRGRFRVSF